MPAMTIHCHDLATLAATCAALVREGVTFRACTASLIITLLGGF